MIKPKYIIFTLSILFGHILIAQDIDIEIPDSLFIIDQEVTDEIIDPIEQQPRFPGGQDSLWCFLETQFDKSIKSNRRVSNALGPKALWLNLVCKNGLHSGRNDCSLPLLM